MRRRLFHLATAVSTLLLLLACVLWVRSYWVATTLTVGPENAAGQALFPDCAFASNWGYFSATDPIWPTVWKTQLVERSAVKWSFERRPGQSSVTDIELPGIRRVTIEEAVRYASHTTVAYWLIALVLAILPAVWLLTRRGRVRRARVAKGLCWRCGYDLVGNVNAEACPECGEAVA